jgi:nucleotidyltransferase/DNA polymerase involved in DNA repair
MTIVFDYDDDFRENFRYRKEHFSKCSRELEIITLEELVDKTLACSHIVGYTDQTDRDKVRGQWLAALSDENIKCLAMGAVIIQQARDAVKEKTGFTCSAGIAHNKVNIRYRNEASECIDMHSQFQ